MKHYGRIKVPLMLPGVKGRGAISFEVTEVKRPILSANRLMDRGYQVNFVPGDPHLLRNDGVKIPLQRRGGLHFLDARVGYVARDRPPSGTTIATADVELFETQLPPGPAPEGALLQQPVGEQLIDEDPEEDKARRRGTQRTNSIPHPQAPSATEVAEHELTHLPAKPWCEHCIRGRGKDNIHKQKLADEKEVAVPIIEMDYFYVTDEAVGQVGFVAVCCETGYTFCSMATENGPVCTYGISSMVSWLGELGHAWFVMQSDGEPALVAFRDACRVKYLKEVAAGTVQNVAVRVSPVGSHGSKWRSRASSADDSRSGSHPPGPPVTKYWGDD